MSTNPTKQIVYRLDEEDFKNLRIKAAHEDLTPNQYAKKHTLELLRKDEKKPKES
ncbi:NmrA family NAD(P)-binding protein [Acinetobacter sp. NIPH 1852]|uniref:NmrA family NAD(P)-binding protein n=1 Tax=Acinetobacter sp. NIPH 1852 TaxID=2923428 RepID=UPI001F4AFB24|nr:NmrA family NAD(P)-binding protein [Acinetobacter sp. NIPH 1852]MCH7306586.1 NmrA family NAD(P)-binding protein [Acinetobacter sp. NIPH 1852]